MYPVSYLQYNYNSFTRNLTGAYMQLIQHAELFDVRVYLVHIVTNTHLTEYKIYVSKFTLPQFTKQTCCYVLNRRQKDNHWQCCQTTWTNLSQQQVNDHRKAKWNSPKLMNKLKVLHRKYKWCMDIKENLQYAHKHINTKSNLLTSFEARFTMCPIES